jgi:hypothetical protein
MSIEYMLKTYGVGLVHALMSIATASLLNYLRLSSYVIQVSLPFCNLVVAASIVNCVHFIWYVLGIKLGSMTRRFTRNPSLILSLLSLNVRE